MNNSPENIEARRRKTMRSSYSPHKYVVVDEVRLRASKSKNFHYWTIACLGELAILLSMYCVVLFPTQIFGQTENGTITGLISDSSGAPIAGADVVIKHTATGVENRTKTNQLGVFTMPYLPVGTYEVRVSAPNFQTTVQTGVVLDPASIARVDLGLLPGEVSQSITVTADAPLIEAEKQTFDSTINENFVASLPVQVSSGSRDATTFINMTPGAQGNQYGINVGSGQSFGTEVLLDGVPMAYLPSINVPLSARAPVDVIAQVHVQAGVPNAEDGHSSGGIVTEITRSGTSEYHAGAQVFAKNTVLDATPYNSKTKSNDQQFELPVFLGGPLYIPHIYEKRDRTFFFFDYTGYRQHTTSFPQTATVPTDQEREGDFSDFSTTIYDPLTGQPFQNNKIDSSRFSSMSKQYLEFIPEATNSNLTENYVGYTPTYVNEDHDFVRIDHKINDAWSVSGMLRFDHTGNQNSSGAFGPKLSTYTDDEMEKSLTIQPVWIIKTNLLNNLSLSYQRWTLKQVGTPSMGMTSVKNTYAEGFPNVSIGTYYSVSLGNSNNQNNANVTWDFHDALTWVTGKHTLKFGFRVNEYNQQTNGIGSGAGGYSFSPLETSGGAMDAGNSFASFLLGLVDSASMGTTEPNTVISNYYAAFGEDFWRLTSKLTLNLGFRYDWQTPWAEKNGNMSIMDMNEPNPGAGNIAGAVIFAGKGTGRNGKTGFNAFMPTWHGGFNPRVGLAYSLTPTITGRLGYGILYAAPSYIVSTVGFSGSSSATSSKSGATPAFNWDEGWPTSLVHKPPFIDPTILNGQGATSINAENGYSNRESMLQIWQADVQYSLKGYLFDLGYVGELSTHLSSALENPNQLPVSLLSLGALLNKDITDPAVVAAGYKAPYERFTGSLAQALRKFPQYQSVGINSNVGSANYNALLLKAEKRYSNGLQYLVSYAFSKDLTNASLSQYGLPAPQDQANRRAEKGLAGSDIPNRLVLSTTYRLPIGHGAKWVNSGVLGHVAEGISVSASQTYQSGLPIAIQAPNYLPIFNGTLHADRGTGPFTSHGGRGSIHLANSLYGTQGTPYLNREAFAYPDAYTLGNLPLFLPSTRNIGSETEDISLFKTQQLKDKLEWQVHADFFNAFNRKNFGGLVTDMTSPSFGQYTSNATSPRTIQLGMKVSF